MVFDDIFKQKDLKLGEFAVLYLFKIKNNPILFIRVCISILKHSIYSKRLEEYILYVCLQFIKYKIFNKLIIIIKNKRMVNQYLIRGLLNSNKKIRLRYLEIYNIINK